MKNKLGVSAVELNEYYPFGKQTYFFEDIVKNTRDLGIELFFFSPLNWAKDLSNIDGYMFKESSWQQTNSKLPKVIYDRSFGKTENERKKIEDFRIYLKTNNISVLNPIDYSDLLNDKLAFHKFLLKNNIPSLESFSFNELLNKKLLELLVNNSIYLKPTFGTNGRGIYVIDKENSLFILKNNVNSQSQKFKNIEELFDFFKNNFNTNEYFIQPKADTVNYDNKPFDIRLIIQNYGVRDYRVSGYGVRIGIEGSFVSNINAGGSVLPIEFLSEFYKNNYYRDIYDEVLSISNICINCCYKLHELYGNFLEIGFDVLLTKDKGPIILEGNSKPSRWIFNMLAENYKDNKDKYIQYKTLRTETVRVPVVYTKNNFFFDID